MVLLFELNCRIFFIYLRKVDRLEMKHLVIRNFGPLQNVDIELGLVNLIIGLQSSGKTCVLRTACFCSWVEKRIMLLQSADYFADGSMFIDSFLGYYRMENYLKDDTVIEYSSSFVHFSFDNSKTSNKFICKFQSGSWRYCRAKVSYIPSDRNVVSLFKDYKQLPNAGSHLQDFMTEWDKARRQQASASDILGLGVNYSFDINKKMDLVTLKDGKILELSETSSGMQSMLPLFVYTDYLTKGVFKDKQANLTDISLVTIEEIKHTFESIYNRCLETRDGERKFEASFVLNGKQQKYLFSNSKERDKFNRYVVRLLQNDHSEIFLEEPENNLFPPTQCQFVNWILERMSTKTRHNFLFVTTHSPYVLSYFLQENIADFKLMITYPCADVSGLFSVKTASEEELQNIYDNGSDAFFNIEAFTH